MKNEKEKTTSLMQKTWLQKFFNILNNQTALRTKTRSPCVSRYIYSTHINLMHRSFKSQLSGITVGTKTIAFSL